MTHPLSPSSRRRRRPARLARRARRPSRQEGARPPCEGQPPHRRADPRPARQGGQGSEVPLRRHRLGCGRVPRRLVVIRGRARRLRPGRPNREPPRTRWSSRSHGKHAHGADLLVDERARLHPDEHAHGVRQPPRCSAFGSIPSLLTSGTSGRGAKIYDNPSRPRPAEAPPGLGGAGALRWVGARLAAPPRLVSGPDAPSCATIT